MISGPTRLLGVLAVSVGLSLLAAGCSSGSSAANGAVPLRLQLSWVPNGQFAGYYVAKAQGYYRQAGLDVTILPGGPNVDDIDSLANGTADLTVDRATTLFAAVEKGVPIKAIAQTVSGTGFWLVAKKDTGITRPADLIGKRIGIFSDSVFLYDAMLAGMGIRPSQVQTFYEGVTMTPFIQNQYPVAMVTTWDELQTLYESGIKPNQLTYFKPEQYGASSPQGCIIATDQVIRDHPRALEEFVSATLKGWEYAFAHPARAVALVTAAAGPNGGANASEVHEMADLEAMKALMWPEGREPADWGTIPIPTYQAEATEVYKFHYVSSPVNVNAAIDPSIALRARALLESS